MSAFTVEVGSDQEHEDLIAEILFGGEVVAVISQERGPGILEIKFVERESGKPWSFPLSEFELVVKKARERLLELKKD